MLKPTRRLGAPLAAAAIIVSLAGCSGGDPITMPDLVGKKLDAAKTDVQKAGFDEDVEVDGGGMFGIVVESNWTVCSQKPAGGKAITDAPQLTVARSCGDKDEEPSETPVEEPSETPVEEPSETPVEEPSDSTITVICYTPNYEDSIEFTIDRLNPDFSEAWETDIPVNKKWGTQTCDDADEDGPRLAPVTPVEEKIWADARDSGSRERWTLTIPYYQCVQHDSPEYKNTYPDHPNLAGEAATMLMLCPNHPNAAAIRERIAVQEGFDQQISDGVTINDGTWRVGQDVEPGTYRTQGAGRVFDCYWARQTDSGAPIDSGFSGNDRARTITVTIAPGDSWFYTEGCGVWFRM